MYLLIEYLKDEKVMNIQDLEYIYAYVELDFMFLLKSEELGVSTEEKLIEEYEAIIKTNMGMYGKNYKFWYRKKILNDIL